MVVFFVASEVTGRPTVDNLLPAIPNQLPQPEYMIRLHVSTAKAEGDIFKIVGNQVVIKTSKEKIGAELKHKKELIDLRLKNMQKQEQDISTRIEELREKIMKKISGHQKN